MTLAGARAVMRLTRHCLGARRADWGAAMDAEFEEAVRDGKPLGFAIGCLFTAWREMAMAEEGRTVLTRYALAIGMLLPIAALQLDSGLGPPAFESVGAESGGTGGNPYLVHARASGASLVALLSLLLAAAHLSLAWTLVDGDWSRIVKSAALIGATTVTLSLFAGVMLLDLSALLPHVAGLAVGYGAIALVARPPARFARVPTDPAGG